VRQWTSDQRGWYRNGPPFFGNAGSANVFVYGMLTLAFIVLMVFRGANFQYCSLTGSDRLHRNMLHRCAAARGSLGGVLVVSGSCLLCCSFRITACVCSLVAQRTAFSAHCHAC
jgi:hypothetical protein